GRRTQSGLYRVTKRGQSVPRQPVALRQSNEALPAQAKAHEVWTDLNDTDHWIRHAARVELESQPLNEWSEHALTEKRPVAALTALLALSRAGETTLQPKILTRLAE